MSKFAKDVLDSSSHFYALARSFFEFTENGMRTRPSDNSAASQNEATKEPTIDERATLREDLFW